MYCICCKRNNVKPIQDNQSDTEEDLLWKNETVQKHTRTIESEMIRNGGIQIIDLGYGSKYDGDRIILAICDECIKENLEDGTLLYFNNYLSNIGVEEEVKKSKKLYRRRSSLDDLVGDE